MRALVAKTLRFADAPPARTAVLAKDVSDSFDFSASSESLRPFLPPDWSVARVERGATPNDKQALDRADGSRSAGVG
jgi:hypothetical protein